MRIFSKLSKLLELKIVFFALPLVFVGIILALYSPSYPRLVFSYQELIWLVILVVLTFFFGRSAGMGLNRVIDAKIDAKNPRTKNRLLPSGLISKRFALSYSIINLALCLLSSYLINVTTFYLTCSAAFFIVTYSFLKRFSVLCHFVIGITHFFLPICTWAALRGDVALPAIALGIAALLRMAGGDILYAFLDLNFDKEEGLYSIPARFGKKFSLKLTFVLYLLSVFSLVLVGVYAGLNVFYYIGMLIASFLLFRQWNNVRTREEDKILRDFLVFHVGFPTILLLAVIIGIL